MTDRGATTVWESWEGIDADGVPHESLNHYSKGAVIDFLHLVPPGTTCVVRAGGREMVAGPGRHEFTVPVS